MIRLGLKLTGRSHHDKARHACIILRGGAIVAMACNTSRAHAEQRALGKLRFDDRSVHTVLWSIRIDKAGRLGMARPCAACMDAIRRAGVKQVYFTDREGAIQTFKVR